MAQTIYADSDLVSEELVYGRQSYDMIEALSQGIGRYSEVLTDAGAQFMARSREVFERYAGHNAIRNARRALRGVTGFLAPDVITDLDNLIAIQLAKPRMQRFIMADIETRRRWMDQRIEGYAESYEDRFPGFIGHDHYDYRISTDGMVLHIEDEEGNLKRLEVTHFWQELLAEDDLLSLTEKFDIQRTRSALRAAYRLNGEDPTSRFGAMM